MITTPRRRTEVDPVRTCSAPECLWTSRSSITLSEGYSGFRPCPNFARVGAAAAQSPGPPGRRVAGRRAAAHSVGRAVPASVISSARHGPPRRGRGGRLDRRQVGPGAPSTDRGAPRSRRRPALAPTSRRARHRSGDNCDEPAHRAPGDGAVNGGSTPRAARGRGAPAADVRPGRRRPRARERRHAARRRYRRLLMGSAGAGRRRRSSRSRRCQDGSLLGRFLPDGRLAHKTGLLAVAERRRDRLRWRPSYSRLSARPAVGRAADWLRLLRISRVASPASGPRFSMMENVTKRRRGIGSGSHGGRRARSSWPGCSSRSRSSASIATQRGLARVAALSADIARGSCVTPRSEAAVAEGTGRTWRQGARARLCVPEAHRAQGAPRPGAPAATADERPGRCDGSRSSSARGDEARSGTVLAVARAEPHRDCPSRLALTVGLRAGVATRRGLPLLAGWAAVARRTHNRRPVVRIHLPQQLPRRRQTSSCHGRPSMFTIP